MFLYYLVANNGKSSIVGLRSHYRRHNVFMMYNPSECVFMVPRFTWEWE